MKFAHMADCHIGGWREPRMRDLSIKSFESAVESIIYEKVDFLLIAGDLFHTSLPPFDILKLCVSKLKQLNDNKIPVYIIPGSHDFSPSGKTIIDVFEEAGLLINVFKGKIDDKKLTLKFTEDKSGAMITGIIGKRGMLDKGYYEKLDNENLEAKKGFKIFMLHTALDELKPKDMENIDSFSENLLPKGFDYYAAGHVHSVMKKEAENGGTIVYPGPLFPNNFRELEKLNHGSFFIYDNGDIIQKKIELVSLVKVNLDCTGLTPEKALNELANELKEQDVVNKIVMIRLFGVLETGSTSDLDLREIIHDLYSRKAFFVMRNTHKLTSKEYEIEVEETKSVEDIEKMLIKNVLENVEALDVNIDKKDFPKKLMKALNSEKDEGEKVYEYEKRVGDESLKLFDL